MIPAFKVEELRADNGNVRALAQALLANDNLSDSAEPIVFKLAEWPDAWGNVTFRQAETLLEIDEELKLVTGDHEFSARILADLVWAALYARGLDLEAERASSLRGRPSILRRDFNWLRSWQRRLDPEG